MSKAIVSQIDFAKIPTTHRFFRLDELYASQVALRLGIMNLPSASVQRNLHLLIYAILDPIRARWSAPIHVTSGYRCPELNRAVNGSDSSMHMLGLAADIVPTDTSRESVRRLFQLCEKMMRDGQLPVAQLIDERDYSWIHISVDAAFLKGLLRKPRNQVLHL